MTNLQFLNGLSNDDYNFMHIIDIDQLEKEHPVIDDSINMLDLICAEPEEVEWTPEDGSSGCMTGL